MTDPLTETDHRDASQGNSPRFTDTDAGAAWDLGAAAWDQFLESGADYYRHEVHGPALLAAAEPLGGRMVLDIGCGQGYFSRLLAKRGGRVIAIDVSGELIALATSREQRERLGIEYRLLSASRINEHLAPGSLDLATACMSLQDCADVESVLRAVSEALRPGGRLVFSVPHPATETPLREWERDASGHKRYLKQDRYFDSGPATCTWNMPRLAYHWSTPYWRRTLSEWMTVLTDRGFHLTALSEPRPTPEQVAANPRLEDCYRMPYFLILNVEKPPLR